jgi:hypothetical protein
MAGSNGTAGGAAGGWRLIRGTGAALAGVGEEGIWKEPPGARVTILLEVDLMGVVTSRVHLSAIRDKAISNSISPEGDVVLIPVGVDETSNI